jgi:hypothetical protein
MMWQSLIPFILDNVSKKNRNNWHTNLKIVCDVRFLFPKLIKWKENNSSIHDKIKNKK